MLTIRILDSTTNGTPAPVESSEPTPPPSDIPSEAPSLQAEPDAPTENDAISDVAAEAFAEPAPEVVETPTENESLIPQETSENTPSTDEAPSLAGCEETLKATEPTLESSDSQSTEATPIASEELLPEEGNNEAVLQVCQSSDPVSIPTA